MIASSASTGSPAAPATAVKAETLALFQPALEAKGGAGLTNAQKAVTDLGRHLYYEERLSGNDKISCTFWRAFYQYWGLYFDKVFFSQIFTSFDSDL